MDDLKPFELSMSDEFKQAVIDGATHVAVSYMEYPTFSRGSVIAVGSEHECEEAKPIGLVVCIGDCTPRFAVWESSVILNAIAGRDAKVLA